MTADNGTDGNDTNGDGTNTTDTDTNDNGTDTTIDETSPVSLLDSGLSHSGTTFKSEPSVANDPQILSSGRERVAGLSNSPAIIFEVVSNQGTSTGLDCSGVGAQYNSCSIVNLHIADSNGDLNDSDWKLYFHSTRRMLQISSDEFNLTHVNGDLHYLSPNAQFSGFGGNVKSVKLITEFSHLVETDFQPRYWIARNGSVQLIANTDDDTNESAYAMDITGNNRLISAEELNPLATSSNRFERNATLLARTASIPAIDVAARIVPKPRSVVVGSGTLDIGSGFSFANLPIPADSIAALQTRQAQFMSTAAGVPLQAGTTTALAANEYTLSVDASGITIEASNNAGIFYAAQSLLSLVQPGVGSIPYVQVSDTPRFGYRGMHVDVARNFHSVASMKKLIDQMGAYKLNRLHMHLSDDEGWRLEIPSLPELTSVGAKREFNVDDNGFVTETSALMPAMGSGPNSDNQGSGFYTQAQFIDLLRYASARYIQVIPELDMPAHARAAVVAMRARANNLGDANDTNIRIDDPADTTDFLTVQNYNDSFINPCVPGSLAFVQSVVTDVKAMYTAANAPLNVWHMGGDEAINIKTRLDDNADQPWSKSPACDAFISSNASVASRDELTPYFVQQVAQVVADAGISTLFAYQDIYDNLSPSSLATSAGINHWVSLAQNGTSAISSANDFNARGFETVIGAPDFLYFDFPYEVDPKERGYYWATRKLDTQKLFSFAPENQAQNAETSVSHNGSNWSATNTGSYTGYTGMQGFVWSETIRTPEQFDYMIYPRMLALAERAWHEASWEQPYVEGENYSATTGKVDTTDLNNDYATFALALANKEFAKLDAAGVAYRIPPPGAQLQGGVLQMNTNFQSLGLQYSSNGNTWQAWDATNPPAAASLVRSVSSNGSRTGRATPVE